ncbi:hypothetical protein OHC33_003351 [Knufia fluminis]|uniref:Uncharacterized protein n=1 Tax=Knufia fluminis TaxID=191047 RepID=A0AAN8ETV9_9EURO|nr:hypothetical protein OHC33_003351 [Knufia fluminis]
MPASTSLQSQQSNVNLGRESANAGLQIEQPMDTGLNFGRGGYNLPVNAGRGGYN